MTVQGAECGGFIRQPYESLKNWIERLKKEIPTSDLMEDVSSLIELHYRYRFDQLYSPNQ